MALEGSFPALWVKGEISNLATPASGHIYFSLKDENAQVRCAMFRGRNRQLKFRPENGDEVLVLANISLYEGRGDYQLIIEQMEASGVGALQRAFEQLKQKLLQEGLFAEHLKQALPQYPKSIGVLTSPTGAAVRDVLSVLERRYPMAQIIVYPSAVQGEAAIPELQAMLNKIVARNEVDVLIITRGGGSIEDLVAFNDETLARAVHACPIPIVSAIGHEIDFTILDFVADVRAPTPSVAAELVCPTLDDLQQSVTTASERMTQAIVSLHYELTMRLEYLSQRLFSRKEDVSGHKLKISYLNKQLQSLMSHSQIQRQNQLQQTRSRLTHQNPVSRMALQRNQYANLKQRLLRQIDTLLQQDKDALRVQKKALEMASPLSILSRGYSVIRDKKGKFVQSIEQLTDKEIVEMILNDGRAEASILKTHPKKLNE